MAITIMGPTASGKTDLAIALNQALDTEIISVDSALVYRGLDIGSAKPSKEELALAPHRLIDIRDPSEPYSAADFCVDAKIEIEDIVRRGKTPVLVGGTMMYFKALLEGLSDLPVADEVIRNEIALLAKQQGWLAVHAELAKVDPISASEIHPNHSQRLSRALEIYRITGKTMSSQKGELKGGVIEQYDWHQFAIAPRDRRVLHQRIADRFEKMLDSGFIHEVESLKLRSDLHKDLPAIRAVGYRQVWEYLDGDYDIKALSDKGTAATRQLAKRQLTWLRSWQSLNWLYTQGEDGKTLSCEEVLTNLLSIIRDKRL